MTQGPTAPGEQETTVLESWVARTLHPAILLGVVGVFAAFTTLAFFVFHSTEAVKALLFTAVGAVIAATPAVLSKVEYRLTPSGLDRRRLATKGRAPFREVFRWDELSHVARSRHGFTFHKRLDEASAMRRFLALHLDDRYSGEVRVERADLDRVLDALATRGVTFRR